MSQKEATGQDWSRSRGKGGRESPLSVCQLVTVHTGLSRSVHVGRSPLRVASSSVIVVLSLSIMKAVDMDMWRISVILLAVFCGRSLSWGGGKLEFVFLISS